MKLKIQRCSKLKMKEPCLEIKVKVQRIKESKANEAEVMVWRIRGPELVKEEAGWRSIDQRKTIPRR